MKKSLLVLTIVLTMLISAIPVFADSYSGFYWGDNQWSGSYWGFDWARGLGTEEGKVTGYFHIRDNSIYNRTIKGQYFTDGQKVSTIIGAKLGVQYSKYVANFSDNVLGIRVTGYQFGDIKVDGVYIVNDNAAIDGTFKSNAIAMNNSDYALNINGQFPRLNNMKLNLTLLSDSNEFGVMDVRHNFWALEPIANITPSTTLSGVYLFYDGNDEYTIDKNSSMYRAIIEHQAIPDVLKFKVTLRDSDENYPIPENRRGFVAIHKDGGYAKQDGNQTNEINEAAINEYPNPNYIYGDESNNLLNDIYKRGKGYTIGATVNFSLFNTNFELRGDYDSKALRDTDIYKLSAGIKADHKGYTLSSNYAFWPSDEEVIDPSATVHQLSTKAATPAYQLSAKTTAQALFNSDLLLEDGETTIHNRMGLKLNTETDIAGAKGIKLGLIAMYDMPIDGRTVSEKYPDENDTSIIRPSDRFKYGFRAEYKAPNKISFLLDYFSSNDYSKTSSFVYPDVTYDYDIHAESWDPYGDYRFYSDCKPGWRFLMMIPM